MFNLFKVKLKEPKVSPMKKSIPLPKQEELEIYLDPWLNFMDHVNNDIEIESSSKTKTKKYTAKHALLEYMGLWEGQELSVIQKDVKKLVKRFRDSNCSPITTTIKNQI